METRIGRNRVVAIVLHVLLAAMLICATSDIFADTFGSGDNQFDIEFVTIGESWQSGRHDGQSESGWLGGLRLQHRQVRNQSRHGREGQRGRRTGPYVGPDGFRYRRSTSRHAGHRRELERGGADS